MRTSRKQEAERARAMDHLMPLFFFYERDGRTMPPIEFVKPREMPEFERELLAHDHDMTSTLEEYHSSRLGLNVIEMDSGPDCLMRMVVLERERPPRIPVEFGAIAIQLESFAPQARRMITECRIPLGAVLEEEKVDYDSEPRSFFRLVADRFIADLLAESEGAVLWGRCNALMDGRGTVFADIVEVLPRALAPVPHSVHRNGRSGNRKPPRR